ncbi:MAG: DUF3667 domain-containing protein [Siphonobacter aquaeclarae]|nr:DUF3667 domain-containing protein [Siphonobacter aquaeclarae]
MQLHWHDHKHRRKTTACPNCGEILKPAANFCPNCGQENHNLDVPLGHLIYEFVESIFHFDTKFWETARAIFTKPGLITKDFVEGKRARYVPPARLYIFISFIFFLVLNTALDKAVEEVTEEKEKIEHIVNRETASADTDSLLRKDNFWRDPDSIEKKLAAYTGTGFALNTDEVAVLKDQPTAQLQSAFLQFVELAVQDSLRTRRIQPDSVWMDQYREDMGGLKNTLHYIPIHVDTHQSRLVTGEDKTSDFLGIRGDSALFVSLPKMTAAQLDSVFRLNGEETEGLSASLHKKAVRALAKTRIAWTNKDTHAFVELTHKITKTISTVMFILMPVVALLLYIFYYRRKRYYYEHFIFSVHIHSVLFLFISLELLIRHWLPVNWLAGISIWICWFYFLVALRRVYAQGWWKTTFKFVLLSLTYLSLAAFLLAGSVLYGFVNF